MSRWRFRALDFSFELCCSLATLDDKLEALVGGYEKLGPDEFILYRYRLERKGDDYLLWRDKDLSYQGESQAGLLDFFQIELYRRIITNSHRRWLLHAAALSQGNQVLVLAGPSDAGKSTLCRALMDAGWTYLSEEVVSLGEQTVDALRRPLNLDAPAQVPLGLEAISLREDPPLWIAKPPPWPEGLRLEELRVAALVRVQYQPSQKTSLRRLSEGDARDALWPCRMNGNIEVAQLASRIVAARPCYWLDSADLPSALAAIDTISEIEIA